MGKNSELSFLDILSIASFCIGLQNLDMNITQEDVQEVASDFDKRLAKSIADIHEHLAVQDAKLNIIMEEVSKRDR